MHVLFKKMHPSTAKPPLTLSTATSAAVSCPSSLPAPLLPSSSSSSSSARAARSEVLQEMQGKLRAVVLPVSICG